MKFTYGGAHHNGLIKKGNDHLSTLVTTWLVNMLDVSLVMRHNKPWSMLVETIGRLYKPHFKQHGSLVYECRSVNVISYLAYRQFSK